LKLVHDYPRLTSRSDSNIKQAEANYVVASDS
jgi:hypothetical protein